MRIIRIVRITFGLAMMVLVSGCSVIDEDLSDCDEALMLDYDLHLVTNMSIELQKEFDRQADANLLKALRSYLSPVFTDYARDIHLSFYDVQADAVLLHQEQHQMDANEMSYALFLPNRQYMHIATANVDGNGTATLEGSDYRHTAGLLQPRSDTVSTHKTGLFTARKMIQQVEKGGQNTVYVHLYMANCAAGLVLDTSEAKLKDLKVLATGFASGFNIADSSYVYSDKPQMVVADKVNTGNNGQQCFCTVNFPSPESGTTRTVTETEDPFVSLDALDALWQFRVYATLPDGKVTESVLGVKKPLRAGQLKIIHARVYSNGGLEPDEPEVAVSITLDWKEAGNYPVPL